MILEVLKQKVYVPDTSVELPEDMNGDEKQLGWEP